MQMRYEPSQVVIFDNRVRIEFPNGRTLEASKDFFEFVGKSIAKERWTLSDLTKDDQQHRIACLDTQMRSDSAQSIWFSNKYFDGCGITTICEWYQNPKSIGTKVRGKRLPNGQKVSDRDIYLPF